MYKKYLELLRQHETTTYQVAKATGIRESVLSDWKTRQEWNDRHTDGRQAGLSITNLKKLADYFGVSLDYFVED